MNTSTVANSRTADTVVAALPAAVVIVVGAFVAQDRIQQLDGKAPLLIIIGLIGIGLALLPSLRRVEQRGFVVTPNMPPAAQLLVAPQGRPVEENEAPTMPRAQGRSRPPRQDSRPQPAPPTRPGTITSVGSSIAFSIPKIDTSDEDCEDAFIVDPARSRVAVADGASSSYGARDWARQITRGFVESPPEFGRLGAFDQWVEVQRQALTSQPKSAPPAAGGWWADECARRGAFATVLGVEIIRQQDGSTIWRAVAVGDSCLIHMRPGPMLQTVSSFPVEPGGHFGSHPALLHSGAGAERSHGVRWAADLLLNGDVLLMMTDAVSEWALTDPARLPLLVGMNASALSAQLVMARSTGEIVNDDLTVVRIVHNDQLR
jgi:hypothetical protein